MCALLFNSIEDLIRGFITTFSLIFESLVSSCMLAVVVCGTASKTEAMYFPSPRQRYTDGNTSNFPVDDTGSISFTEIFRYLGSIIHYSHTSDADVDYRISKASAAFGALSNVFRNKHVSNHLNGEVYKVLVLSTLLYGCEVWSLREDLFNRLRSFHKRCARRCARSMCRVSLYHAFHHHISSATLFQRLNVMDLDSYYHNRILRWAGHVARMPFRQP
jgi:hypothetical protein